MAKKSPNWIQHQVFKNHSILADNSGTLIVYANRAQAQAAANKLNADGWDCYPIKSRLSSRFLITRNPS